MKRYVYLVLIALMAMAVGSGNVYALTDARVQAPWVSTPPTLDGILDDEAWKIAENKGSNMELKYTNQGMAASGAVEAWVCWDDKNLYISVKNYQGKDKLVTNIRDNQIGGIWGDSSNELFIDPYVDGAGIYYQLITNALGFRWHNAYNSKTPLSSGDFDVWAVGVKQYDDYWILEAKIPFELLGKQPKAGDLWGFNVCANVWVNSTVKELTTWSPLTGSFLNPPAFGGIEFVK